MSNPIKQFINLLLRKASEESVTRDLTYGNFYDQIYHQLCAVFDYPYIMEIMKSESEGDYVVVNDDGKLWKVKASISGQEVILEAPIEVTIDFPEVESRGFVFRSADGKLKFVSISSAAVLNRSGDLDSKALFDDMEANFDTYSKEKAYLQFYHLGRAFKFGEVGGCFRMGSLFITYGDIDESNPLGKMAEKRFNEEGWGVSIGFMPLAEPEKLVLNRELSVDVYNKGYLVEVSVLREKDAASLFTNILGHKVENREVKRMSDAKRTADRLKEWLGEGSDDLIANLLEQAEVRERTIEEKKMITRKNEETSKVEATEVPLELQIDDELLGEIVTQATSALEEKIAEFEKRFAEGVDKMTELFAQFEATSKSLETIQAKVDTETKERQKEDEDTPAKTVVNARYRPTVERASNPTVSTDTQTVSPAEIARIKRNKGKS